MIEKINPYNKLKKGAGNLLKPIQRLTNFLPENAFIAGGFVRDIYHGKPFKDIDIFIDYTKVSKLYTEIALKETFGNDIKLEAYDFERGDDYKNAEHIDKIFRVVGAPIPIDVIAVGKPKPTILDIISDFDLSINQCVLNGIYDAYVNTSKTVSYSTEYGVPNKDRIDKLKAKYEELDWSKVLPKAEVLPKAKVNFPKVQLDGVDMRVAEQMAIAEHFEDPWRDMR